MTWQIFSDLDGTLLDVNTYTCDAAQPALSYLREKKIPVIPCTSKTHLEVIKLRRKLNLHDPFIVENGSAIFIPDGCFKNIAQKQSVVDGYKVLILGKEYAEITKLFAEIKTKFKLPLSGFNEMSIKQVQKLTGLDEQGAILAKSRFFSEPFVLNKLPRIPEKVKQFIHSRGFRLLQGNRFYHLLGDTDKGHAVKTLARLYADHSTGDGQRTIGIGDSMNDLEMLHAVDFPVLVNKPGGKHQQGIELDNLVLTERIGPAGWNEAVFQLISPQ